MMMTRTLVAAGLLTTAMSALPAAAAPATTFTGPTTATRLLSTHGGMRMRAFGSPTQQEIFLGRTSLGDAANRVAGNLTWVNGANPFSLSYDAVTDTLSSTVNGNTLNWASFRAGLSPIKQAERMNALEIQIRDVAAGAGTMGLSNLMLNGNPILPASFAAPENGAWSYLIRFGSFDKGFTFTGDLNLTGVGTFSSSAESNRVELIAGNGVPEPASWAMMLAGFGLVGLGARRRQLRVILA